MSNGNPDITIPIKNEFGTDMVALLYKDNNTCVICAADIEVGKIRSDGEGISSLRFEFFDNDVDRLAAAFGPTEACAKKALSAAAEEDIVKKSLERSAHLVMGRILKVMNSRDCRRR